MAASVLFYVYMMTGVLWRFFDMAKRSMPFGFWNCVRRCDIFVEIMRWEIIRWLLIKSNLNVYWYVRSNCRRMERASNEEPSDYPNHKLIYQIFDIALKWHFELEMWEDAFLTQLRVKEAHLSICHSIRRHWNRKKKCLVVVFYNDFNKQITLWHI